MSFETKMINLRVLAQQAGVSEHKLYRRKYVPDVKPLTLNDRTKLVNALIEETVRQCKELGFTVTFDHQENPGRHRAKVKRPAA